MQPNEVDYDFDWQILLNLCIEKLKEKDSVECLL